VTLEAYHNLQPPSKTEVSEGVELKKYCCPIIWDCLPSINMNKFQTADVI